jgi:predicted nucleic acid-binding protein
VLSSSKKILIDTGFIIALFNADDEHHIDAKKTAEKIANLKWYLLRYPSAKIDLADASLVVLADQLKTGRIASVDRKDFSILRWNGGKSHFHNLMDA